MTRMSSRQRTAPPLSFAINIVGGRLLRSRASYLFSCGPPILSNTRHLNLNDRFCCNMELFEGLVAKPRPEHVTTAKNDGVPLCLKLSNLCRNRRCGARRLGFQVLLS